MRPALGNVRRPNAALSLVPFLFVISVSSHLHSQPTMIARNGLRLSVGTDTSRSFSPPTHRASPNSSARSPRPRRPPAFASLRPRYEKNIFCPTSLDLPMLTPFFASVFGMCRPSSRRSRKLFPSARSSPRSSRASTATSLWVKSRSRMSLVRLPVFVLSASASPCFAD
jgi:hypothetical protein